MINYRLLNKSKMKYYLSNRIGYKVSESEFQNCIDYFVEYVEFIDETREGNKFIKEGASLEVDIGNEVYEVWVNYNFVWECGENEEGKEVVLIDFNYEYESVDEIFGV